MSVVFCLVVMYGVLIILLQILLTKHPNLEALIDTLVSVTSSLDVHIRYVCVDRRKICSHKNKDSPVMLLYFHY